MMLVRVIASLLAVPLFAQTGTLGPTSISPGAGNSGRQTFTYTFSDTAGAQNISIVNVLTNDWLDGRQACYTAFSNDANNPQFYLLADNGSTLQSHALPLGQAQMTTIALSNTQCTINSARVARAGQVLTLIVDVSYSNAFANRFGGNAVTWLASRNNTGGNTGWRPQGVWGAPPISLTTPSVFSVTPPEASGSSVTYSVVVSDPAGPADIGVVNLLINVNLDGRSACYVAYAVTSNTLFLVDDLGATSISAGSPGGGVSKANTQCTLDAAVSSASTVGKQLTVNFKLRFASGFSGPRTAFAAATTQGGGSSGWQRLGVYAGSVPAPSGTVTVSSFAGPPSVLANQYSVFRFSYIDQVAGPTDIAGGQVAFWPGGAPYSCFLTWDSAGGISISTQNSAQYGYLGQPISLAGDVCGVDLSASTLTPTNLGYDLSLKLVFASVFAVGLHNVNANGENDAGQVTVWQQFGRS